MLAMNENPKERNINPPVGERVDIPEFTKATNCGFDVLLVPAKDRPVVKTDRGLVLKMSPG